MENYVNLRTVLSEKSLDEVKAFFLKATEAQGSFKARIEKLMDYNMTEVMSLPSRIFLSSLKPLLVKATDKQLRDAEIMGWLMSFVNMGLVIMDDIVDESVTRNGKPCWHTLPEVGDTAVLDTNIIFSLLPLAVNHFFEHHPSFEEIAVKVNRLVVNLTKGPLADTGKTGTGDIQNFTMNRYKDKYSKSGADIMSVYLYLFGETKETVHKEMRKIGEELSLMIRAVDDFYDVYSGSGTNISEGKLTWLIAKALEKASPEQKKTLEDNYGKKDDKCIEAVKKIYNELNLKNDFKDLVFTGEQLAESIVRDTKGSKVWGNDGVPGSLAEDIKSVAHAVKYIHPVFANM